ncbi:MAG TPA: hypothetical protein VHB51_00940 [Candidatus Saccharimonadales bacterium]|nr:hypothetical protein [Candidatus Saccharimonadales bacterium]
MSASDINAFLNSFHDSCISTNNGFLAIDPTGYNPTNGFQYGGYVSAGQVIYDAAQAYGLNPQVILATLEKEQSLVTGRNNFYGYCNNGDQNKYAAAVGYGCPDGGTVYSYSGLSLYERNGVPQTTASATCVNSAAKAGFSQQVIRAAWLLRFGEQRSEGNINWAVVKGNWNNSDDPQSCYGGPMTQGTWQRCPSGASSYYDGSYTIDNTSIQIESGGTAALYWYTPHFSGNQSFVNIFNSWFGPTYDRNPLVRDNQTGKFYIRGANNSLIYITSSVQLKDLGYGINWRITSFQAVDDSYVQAHNTSQSLNALVSFGTSPNVYYYAYGGLHYISSSVYQSYGSPAVTVLDGYLFNNYFWVGNQASLLLHDVGSLTPYAYSIESGPVKRYIADQNAWNYYSFSGAPADAGPTVLSLFPDGIPYVKPGTIVTATDADQTGIVNTGGTSMYSISSALNKSLTLNKDQLPSSLISKFTLASPTALTLRANDGSGNNYILDRSQKIALSPAQLTNSGYTAGDFNTAPSLLLNLLATTSSSADRLLFQTYSSPGAVYAGMGKQALWFQYSSDFNAYGYTSNQVVLLAQNTADNLFPSQGVTILPAGLLVKTGSSPSVYLITHNGEKSNIPTAYMFNNLGLSFNNVRTINQQSLNYLVTEPSVLPYAIDGSSNVWLFYNGQKRLVPPSYVSAYNLPGGPNQINSWYIANMPRSYNASKFIRIDNGQNVYYVDSGATHLLSYARYKSLGGTDFSDVTPVSSDLFYSLSQGSSWF